MRTHLQVRLPDIAALAHYLEVETDLELEDVVSNRQVLASDPAGQKFEININGEVRHAG